MRLMAINFAGRSRLAVCSFHPPPHSIPLSSILLCHFVSLFVSPIWSLSNSQLAKQATPKSRQHMLLKPLHMSECVFVQVCGFVSVCVCVYVWVCICIFKSCHKQKPQHSRPKWTWEYASHGKQVRVRGAGRDMESVCVTGRESVRTAQFVAH